MRVTNHTEEPIGIAGVTIPRRQSRRIREWDKVKDSRRVQALLESGDISVPAEELPGEDTQEESLPVNLNTASIEELQTLNGVGHQGALRIITHRPFFEIDDLGRVSGISDGILERNRDRLEV